MIKLNLTTPEKQFLTQEAEMVVVPAAEGEMGVLEKHTPTVASLAPGLVRIYQGEEIKNSVFITGGFVEIDGDTLTILADEALKPEEINKDQTRKQLNDLESELVKLSDQENISVEAPEQKFQKQKLTREIHIAEAKLEVEV